MYLFSRVENEPALENDLVTRVIRHYQVELVSCAVVLECSMSPVSAINAVLLLVFAIMAWSQFT